MEVSYQTLTMNELSELIGGNAFETAGYYTGKAAHAVYDFGRGVIAGI
ncbi:hypothetical protein ACVRWB_06340 [Streptococcus troglodytae]|uniref:Uncharacterized protein n=1 Tax=Streptococcus troglodytae TaxID=1111760 RepID=A0A1L7LGN0_9STRE|nr:hypothetical protein [Streptococcus troglodytae]BAQ23288.1 putative uncharacterized protein [Streptococcus troglodytae]